MHSSAHDKAQRQRGVLPRRGRCVQRALRGVVTRLRTRRTLVVTAALVLLVLALLALCHARLLSQRPAHRDGAHDNAAADTDAVADDSTSHVAASPSDRWLLRPDTQHGGSVRVMLLMVSTRASEQLCYALASAYFADLPVVVLGYGGEYKSHIWRWQVYLDAMQRAALRDRDVVLLLDSDILFSGEDMQPFIDDYIARSPATPSALDVRAVRAGTARAPSMFAAEVYCAIKHFFVTRAHCLVYYKKIDDAVAAYVARTGVAYDLHNKSVQPLRYLNGGVSIHRVWSLREVARALQQYVTTHEPRLRTSKGFYDDQSAFAVMYNNARLWEVEHDVLRNNSTAAATQRGPHGLRAGQLQLEHDGYFAFVYIVAQSPTYINDMAWRDSVVKAPRIAPYVKGLLQHYVDAVWQRYGGSVRLRQRTMTRVGNGTHTIELAPPLLYVASHMKAISRQPAKMTSPLVWHITNSPKQPRLNRMANVMPWYIPMRYNTTKWRRGRDVVLSSHVELWTAANTTQHVRYGDVCDRHPFNSEQLSKIFVKT